MLEIRTSLCMRKPHETLVAGPSQNWDILGDFGTISDNLGQSRDICVSFRDNSFGTGTFCWDSSTLCLGWKVWPSGEWLMGRLFDAVRLILGRDNNKERP